VSPELETEIRPFILHGQTSTDVRLFTIGPQHLDWLCAYCGKTGNLEGGRVDRWVLALEQMSLYSAIAAEDWRGAVELFDQTGWELARRRCMRTAVDHLQRHLRFESIMQVATVDLSDFAKRVDEGEWPYDDDPPDPL
jgi:hypothetical protein